MTIIRAVKRAFAIVILILVSIARSGAEQLPIRTYTTADGLARDRVYKIVSDPRGYLWFCTYDGLSRFDGYEFVNYTVAHGLPHRQVFDLLITHTGDYWVATANGLAHFNPIAPAPDSKFKAYIPKTRPDAEVTTDLYEDSSGTIWFGTGNGLHVLRQTGNDWQMEYVSLGEKPDEGLDLTSIIEASPGVLLIGAEQGLFRRFSDGKVERFGVKDGLPHPHVRDILKDPDGTLWLATGLGLCRLVANVQQGHSIVERLYTKKDGMLSEGIYALYRTRSGWLWMATTHGVSEFSPDVLPDGGHFINYTREHGLSGNEMRTIAEDQDGNLWVGSESGGAMKITRLGFTSYSEADGLEVSRIAALGEDHSGELYAVTTTLATTSFHIHRFSGRRFENIRVNLPANVVPTWGWNQLFLQDRMQQWWIPANGGLFQFPHVRSMSDLATARPVKVFTSENGLSGNEPFRLYEDSRGDVWISIISTPSHSYLNRWERATGKIYTYSPEMAGRDDSAPTAFQEDRSGNLWIGFYWGGLARYRDGRFESFSKTDGVPAGMIRAFHLDQLGRLWIASTEGGLARVDDPSQQRPTFVHYTTTEGLSSDQITCITEDQWGRIYVGTGIGIDRLEPDTGRVKRFTMADGLPNGFVNVAFRDHNHTLWFGTLQGLSKLAPTMDGPSTPPPILIQQVSVAGNDLPISELGVTQLGGLEFEANKNQLEIKFVSLGFRSGDVHRYQFMLIGADNDWSAPTNQRIVHYANLKPGSYNFLVRAVNADGVFSSQLASMRFTIVPPIWQRWWFITLIVVALIAATHLAYRYHTRRLIELERVRTRIATDLHDDIGASLSKIAILSDVAGQELSQIKGSPALAQIADTSRDCVDAMSDIVWAVNPQRDHLSDLTHRMRRFAEDLLDAKNIDFTIRSTLDEKDVQLGADLRREVYLIFKECINNVVKHSDCTEAGVAFSINGPWLTISITDNGRGFEPSANGNTTGMGGHGLASMQRRAHALRGSLKIDSDLGRGTSVMLKVPIRSRTRWWPYPNGR
ncbi:MAG TPA: two-component regulator propeller domain-containing protein [Pyrinomonadaceae bacterium]|nr:two-component regulator propeller domain-containing protein [Pyrinomonadaceae bacterium]